MKEGRGTKLDRRTLLKAGVASAAALLEGCRQRELAYLEQPVERSAGLPGAPVLRTAVCGQCPAGCLVSVRTVDGLAKKLEGAESSPVNRGGLCALGHSALQELYHPDRVVTPLKRTGARGSGELAAISWEEALQAAGEALLAAVTEPGPSPIAFVLGPGRGLLPALFRRLALAVQAESLTIVEPFDAEVERQAAALALGIDDLPVYDLGESDYVLSVGAPFLDRWRSPVHYAQAFARLRAGRSGRRGKLVLVEARQSLTAAAADEWLPARPGTEGVLARALAGVLLAHRVVPEERQVQYRDLFPTPPPSCAEAAFVCDLPAERIERLGRELARAERAVVLAGGSAVSQWGGLASGVASLALNLLLDNLGKPGGVLAPARFELEAGVLEDGTDGTRLRREAGTSPAPTAGSQGTSAAHTGESAVKTEGSRPLSSTLQDLALRLQAPGGEGVRVLVVCDTDPVHLAPAGWRMPERLARIPTVIALASCLDDTALQADLVLPVQTDLERWSAVSPWPALGAPVLHLARGVAAPRGEARHPGDLALALAATLGPAARVGFPWSSFSEFVEQRLRAVQPALPGGEGVPPARFLDQAYRQGGIYGDPLERRAPPGPSLAQRDPLAPAVIADPVSEAARLEGELEGDASGFPFRLLAFESVKTGADGRGATRPWLQELPDPLSSVMWDGWIEISTADARALGVETGDRLRIVSPEGAVEATAFVTPAARPGCVALPLGLGHRDGGRYARGRAFNAMALIGGEVEISGAPALCATRVRLEPLGSVPRSRGTAFYGRGLRQHEHLPRGWGRFEPRRQPERTNDPEEGSEE